MSEGIVDKIGSMFKRKPASAAAFSIEPHRRRESEHKPLTRDEFIDWAALGSVGDSYGSMSETGDAATRRAYESRSYAAQRKFYSTQDERTVEEMIKDSLTAGILSQEDASTIQSHFNRVASHGNEALTDLREQIRQKSTAYHTYGTPEYNELD